MARRATQLEDEQEAFDKALPSLLEEHAGQYVVFHEGEGKPWTLLA